MQIKRGVYCAVSETWVVKSPSIRHVQGFHNRCIRVILGVSGTRQWKERITSKELASQFGINENMADTIGRY